MYYKNLKNKIHLLMCFLSVIIFSLSMLDGKASDNTNFGETKSKYNFKLELDSITDEGIHLSWNEFTECEVSGYNIFRQELISGKLTLISATNNSSTFFVDNKYRCPQPFVYHIKAIGLCSKTVFSETNKVVAEPESSLMHQKVSIAKSTPIHDSLIITEWLKPKILPELILHYNVYRSIDNQNYKLIARIPNHGTEYVDRNVNTNGITYYYKVEPINTCDIEKVKSNYSPKILLKAKLSNGVTKLKWSKHKEDGGRIEKYVIEKMDPNGNWQVIKTVDGSTYRAEISD